MSPLALKGSVEGGRIKQGKMQGVCQAPEGPEGAVCVAGRKDLGSAWGGGLTETFPEDLQELRKICGAWD